MSEVLFWWFGGIGLAFAYGWWMDRQGRDLMGRKR